MPFELGEALRVRRKDMGLTMQTVADKAGLWVGFISQVERGLATPSLGSLASIAAVLETQVSAFLDQPASGGQTTRHNQRQSYSVPGAQMIYERLSTTFPGSQIHSVITHEPPGYRGEPISHRGEEDYAEALILGCTLEIGFHKELENALGVPVIDPSFAALKRAEYAAGLRRDCGWLPSRKWSCEAPPEEEMAGIGGFDVNAPFGNRIIVEAR